MLLIRCSCGCLFTVKELSRFASLICQNCGANIPLTPQTDLKDYISLSASSGFSVSMIPDDAEIDVSFKA